MPEEVQDVNAEASSTEETVVEKTADATATETTAQETTETQPITETKPQVEAVDEFGVPYKNRFMELQRKQQESFSEEAIEKVARKVAQETQQPREQEYSLEQLELYKLQNTDNPQAIAWAEARKAEVLQKKFASITDDRIKGLEKKQADAVKKQQAEAYVMNHPHLQDCFVTTSWGQKTWNQNHPLTGMIGMYMSEPDLKDRPDALMLASKLALADYLVSQAPKARGQIKKLEQTVKKVQKQTLIESGTSQQDVIKSKTAYNKAMESYATTGSKEALAEVLREKMKGK